MSVNNITFLWLLVLISYICLANARQIRYSRYNTEVIEQASEDNINVAANVDNQTENNNSNSNNNNENEIQATVREIKLAPYPASGFRPSKAFPLPNESAVRENEKSDNNTVTDDIETSTPVTLAQEYESEATDATLQEETEEEKNNNNSNNNEVDDSVNVEEDENVLSQNETPKAPYPAAGYQPRIPFLLPTDQVQQEDEENLTELSVTEILEENSTDLPTDSEFKPKIPLLAAGRNLINTIFKNQENPQKEENEENLTELSATELPEENTTDLPLDLQAKAPYPAAGYRPSKAFLLPTEQLRLADKEAETKQDTPPKEDNSKHPVCGSSTNPLAPKPLEGEKEDPNSESIFVNTQTQQKSQQQQTLLLPVPLRLTAQPVIIARPMVYTTHIQAW